MRHDILQLLLGLDVIRTDPDPVLVVEPTLGPFGARPTADIMRAYVAAEGLDVLAHEDDNGRGLQQLVPVLLAPRAVERAVPLVAVPPVLLGALRGHLARCHAVEVLRPVEPAVAG